MTKFETIGASMQYDSCSKGNAISRFRQSCKLCCNKGMQINCDHCGINIAHELTLAVFEDMEADKRNNASK